MEVKNNYCFLTIGQAAETTEFKRYIGLAQSDILALNPTKKQLEELYGREVQNEPQYFGTDEQTGVKWARLDFIVKTVPEACNGINITTHATFTIRNEQYLNTDGSKVRVLDAYGNSVWMNVDDVKAHIQPKLPSGGNAKIAQYRVAYKGEPELVDFLRKYLRIPDPFEYVNGSFILKNMKHLNELTKEDAMKKDTLVYEKHMFAFDKNDFEAFFKGDTTALWKEIEGRKLINPTLGVTLLYGVRTNNEGKQYQVVCTGYDTVLYKNANQKAIERLTKNISKAKQSGLYSSTDYRVQALSEYTVNPTNLETPSDENLPFDGPSASELPWE